MTDERRALPNPQTDGAVSVEAAIARRRSVRSFGSAPLTSDQVGQLLWSGQGITGDDPRRRAAPSAGGCHPLVFYVCQGSGVWRYHPRGHHLTRHRDRDVRDLLARAAYGQACIAQAPGVLAVSAVFQRTTDRYQERGRARYVPMDAGHAAQNLILQAVALDLVTVPIGAFDDAAVKRHLALPAEEEPLYLIPVGHPPRQ